MEEKRQFFASNLDHVRSMLTREPRGHSAMHLAVLTTATDPKADAAALIMNSSGFLNMCGHGTLGVATVLVEMGLVNVVEPVTNLNFETLGGLIPLRIEVAGGSVKNITFRNLPAFACRHNLPLDVPSIGQVEVDVVYGGLWFVVVEAKQLGLAVSPDHIDELLRLGVIIRDALNDQVELFEPESDRRERVELTLFVGPPDRPDAHGKNVVTMGRHIFDRSPGGTGTSAVMANLWSQGLLELGEAFVNESIIGTTFHGRLVEETYLGQQRAVIPEITGQAYVTGMHQFTLVADDPLTEGFMIGGP